MIKADFKPISPYIFWSGMGTCGLTILVAGILAPGSPIFSQVNIPSGVMLGVGGSLFLTSIAGLTAIAIFNCKNRYGKTRLHEIIDRPNGSNRALLQKLYRWRLIPNIDVRDREGVTLYQYAFERGETQIANDLLLLGADINALNYQNQTVLTWAIIKDDLESFKYLLKQGASLDATFYGESLGKFAIRSPNHKKDQAIAKYMMANPSYVKRFSNP